ncbi:hypothetical protein [Enterobacter sp.]|nr:hypothetical protein [Enterobacter sp.]
MDFAAPVTRAKTMQACGLAGEKTQRLRRCAFLARPDSEENGSPVPV